MLSHYSSLPIRLFHSAWNTSKSLHNVLCYLVFSIFSSNNRVWMASKILVMASLMKQICLYREFKLCCVIQDRLFEVWFSSCHCLISHTSSSKSCFLVCLFSYLHVIHSEGNTKVLSSNRLNPKYLCMITTSQ